MFLRHQAIRLHPQVPSLRSHLKNHHRPTATCLQPRRANRQVLCRAYLVQRRAMHQQAKDHHQALQACRRQIAVMVRRLHRAKRCLIHQRRRHLIQAGRVRPVQLRVNQAVVIRAEVEEADRVGRQTLVNKSPLCGDGSGSIPDSTLATCGSDTRASPRAPGLGLANTTTSQQ